ncbi:MAG: hypothetical protein KBS96_08490 [Lachnospiraceae bacterium]|nr:hypothetical protein [Candidatus Colinaster scatohippi]
MSKKNRGMMMSSCVKSILTFQKNTSLQVNPDNSHTHHRKMLSFSYPIKVAAAMSIEAALAMPIFLFFIANLLSLFIMYERYSTDLSKLHQQAKNTALVAHTTSANDVVRLEKAIAVSPLTEMVGFQSSETIVRANVRKWTGYDVLNGNSRINDEEYVYITENGTVYHRQRSCSHLKITIRVIPYEDVENERNRNGKKYYRCERCGKYSGSGAVFVTNDGNKYHTSASCSGLKRTIYVVKITETGGRGPCSGCS